MAWTPIALPAGIAAVLLAGPVAAAPVTDTFHFVARDINPAGGEDPVSGSVTVTIDLAGQFRSGPVEAIDLTVGGVTYTPANTIYQYDPSVDRLSVLGDPEGLASFDLEIRKTSTGRPGPNDFAYYAADGRYHVAGTTTVTVGRR